jgi:prevent-host-death family protein
MKSVAISTFKATCLALLEQVCTTGEPLLVTRRGKPVAQILPPPPSELPSGGFGAMKGTGRITGDLVEPVGSIKDWEAARPEEARHLSG